MTKNFYAADFYGAEKETKLRFSSFREGFAAPIFHLFVTNLLFPGKCTLHSTNNLISEIFIYLLSSTTLPWMFIQSIISFAGDSSEKETKLGFSSFRVAGVLPTHIARHNTQRRRTSFCGTPIMAQKNCYISIQALLLLLIQKLNKANQC